MFTRSLNFVHMSDIIRNVSLCFSFLSSCSLAACLLKVHSLAGFKEAIKLFLVNDAILRKLQLLYRKGLLYLLSITFVCSATLFIKGVEVKVFVLNQITKCSWHLRSVYQMVNVSAVSQVVESVRLSSKCNL